MKQLILFGLVFVLLLSSVMAESKTENNRYIIQCDKEEYYWMGGEHSAYCTITSKMPVDDIVVDVKTFLVKENSIILKRMNLLDANTKDQTITDVILTKQTEVRAESKQLDQFKIEMDAGKTYMIELVYETDGFGSNEFWVNLEDDKGNTLELDPLITGCTNDSAIATCKDGSFSGSSLTTNMSIIIENATLGALGGVTITSNGWINITNSTIYGYGANDQVGYCYIEANESISINNSHIRCYGGNANVGHTGLSGTLIIKAKENLTVYNSNLTFFGGDGTGINNEPNGGNGNGHFQSSNFFTYNSLFNSEGGLAASFNNNGGEGGSTYNYINSSYAELKNTHFNFLGGKGGGSATGNGDNGGISNLTMHIYELILDNATIVNSGGATGTEANSQIASNSSFNWDGYYFYMKSVSNITNKAPYGTGGGGDGHSHFNLNGYIFNSSGNSTINNDAEGAAGTSKVTLNFKDLLLFNPLRFDSIRPATDYGKIIFSSGNFSAYYKLGLFNQTNIINRLYVECALPDRLIIGNDTKLNSTINVTDSCGLVTYSNYTDFFNASIDTDTLFYLDNCSYYTARVLNITVRDDTTESLVDTDIDAYVYGYVDNGTVLRSFNLSWDNVNKSGICANPSTLNHTIFAQFEYGGEGDYSTKTYYLSNYNITSDTQFLNLYLTPNTTLVTFTVTDQDDDVVQEVYIHILKYDFGTNSYTTSEILKTDELGQGIGNIVLTTQWYKFLLVYDNVIVLETDPVKITSTTRNFRINLLTNFFDFFETWDNTQTSLTFTNATKNFAYTFLNTDGTSVTACLNVVRQTSMTNTLINETCVTSSSGTILINVGETSDYTFKAVGTIQANPIRVSDILFVSFDDGYKEWGKDGIFATFFVRMALAMIGIWNPIVAIILLILADIGMISIGLYAMNTQTFIFYILLGALTIYRVNRK